VAAPRVRTQKADIERLGASVTAAAREISERLFGPRPGQKRA
jgi:DNA-binding IclR family transcriptional regulator